MSRSEKREASRLVSSFLPVYTNRYEILLPSARAASIARVMGAIFMKLGRAPATIVIFILFLSYSV